MLAFFYFPLISFLFTANPLTLFAQDKSTSTYDLSDGPGYCIFSAETKKQIDFKTFEKIISQSTVIYVGETHNQFKDHLAQLEALKVLYKSKGKKVAVGFEMLNISLQPILDDYATGRISQEDFLKKINWEKEWGFDFNLYKPIFDFIREKKLKAIALNVPKKIISKIRRTGLQSLSDEEKSFIPQNMKKPDKELYLNYLKETFSMHLSTQIGINFIFENYFDSMITWNEAMGNRVVEFLKKNKKYSVLVVAGNGHIIYNAGIPFSVQSRIKDLVSASFYTEDSGNCPPEVEEKNLELADFVWFIRHK